MTTRNKSFRAHPLTRAMALAGIPLITAMSMPAQAQDDAEVEELRQRVEQLEQTLRGAVSTAPEATQDNPYILREGDGLKIGDTTISFGGFLPRRI